MVPLLPITGIRHFGTHPAVVIDVSGNTVTVITCTSHPKPAWERLTLTMFSDAGLSCRRGDTTLSTRDPWEAWLIAA